MYIIPWGFFFSLISTPLQIFAFLSSGTSSSFCFSGCCLRYFQQFQKRQTECIQIGPRINNTAARCSGTSIRDLRNWFCLISVLLSPGVDIFCCWLTEAVGRSFEVWAHRFTPDWQFLTVLLFVNRSTKYSQVKKWFDFNLEVLARKYHFVSFQTHRDI